MIDDLSAARPQSGLSSASVVWQAPAEGGIPRYMAIFQDTLPEEHRPGPQLALLLHRLGRGMAGHLRPRRRLAAGEGDAPRQGQRPVRLQRRRVPLQRDLLPGHHPLRPAQPVHDRARSCAASGKQLGAKDKAYKPAWNFAPDAPLDARPYGGTITVKYPYNTISYKYDRKTNTYLRSVTGEKKQTDAGTGTRIAPKNVVVMRMRFGPLNDGHPGAPRLEASVVGSGPAWISTNGRTIKGTWKKTAITKPTQFFDAKGNEVTLTIGQTFVQVVTTSTTGYPVSFKAGSDTPPADAGPERLSGQLSLAGGAVGLSPLGAVRPLRRPPGSRRRRRPRSACRSRPARGRRRPRRSWTPSSAQIVASATARRLRVARLDEQPGRADQLGEWPDR